MCGIAGTAVFGKSDHPSFGKINDALACLSKRGPDNSGIYKDSGVVLGHRRLSVIDTSELANQPMTDPSGRFTIIFNGEFFNYQEHRKELLNAGINLHSHSDTEVLLHLFMREGADCLKKVNGFFALCIYDKQERSLFLARDRMGIKPLLYYTDETHIVFASENKSLLAFGIPREIDRITMQLYFQLNYIPGNEGIIKGVRKLGPGNSLKILLDHPGKEIHFLEKSWYTIPFQNSNLIPKITYENACTELFKRMDAAVERRLVSDVPLGAFLSGGVDSSVIVALAAKHVKDLHTFSIGFVDDPHFDETKHAEAVATHCKTNHKVFRLKTEDLLNALPVALNYLDEPFADSSALAINILSRETKKHVTVALSGDGGDELFAGYKKHRAEWVIRNRPVASWMASVISPSLKKMKGSRQHSTGNRFRQLHRFAEGSGLNPQERYWRWCSISSTGEVNQLLLHSSESEAWHVKERIQHLTHWINNDHDFNQVLLNDMKLVLPSDMLVKVDMMSMNNSLEVRVPFLDYSVVEWAFSIPWNFKIDKSQQKKILKDSFKHLLPDNLFERKKQGFEIPLLRWLRTDLSSMLDKYLNEEFITSQQIFNFNAVQKLRSQMNSQQPGEAASRIWALLVFQHWWINCFEK